MAPQELEARPANPTRIYGALALLGAAIAVVALADFLFYRHMPGISVVIFAAALSVTTLVTNPTRARFPHLAAAFAILTAALVPAVEDFGLLSFIFAVAGVCVFALMAAGWPPRTAAERLFDVIWMAISGPFRLAGDLGSAAEEARRHDVAKHAGNWLVAWIIPLGLGGLFLVLFAQANPLIEQWLTSLDRPRWKDPDVVRLLFWLAVISLTWPFLRVRSGGKPALQQVSEALALDLPPQPLQPPSSPESQGQSPAPDAAAALTDAAPPATAPAEGPLFGRTAILRSLVLFNALFAVQTALDITYLWGGLALPAGMTYASYAHRGAYPLIVTALMAAGFVLAAMRPGSRIARSGLMRALVFLWIGQNVLLVLSSILRLDLYVEVYSLTEWRCAAFVWMLLVATGLVLIIARIVLDRTNRWLVWANAAVLVVVLYVCSLVDFPATIARFNVMHSREVAGAGQNVDVGYLCGLGPAALPALDTLSRATENGLGLPPKSFQYACGPLEARFAARMADWRVWTFRGYRLQQYLEDNPGPRSPPSQETGRQEEAGGTPAVPVARAGATPPPAAEASVKHWPATPADRTANISDAKGQALPESFLWQDWDATPYQSHPNLCLTDARVKCEAKFVDLDGDGAAEILLGDAPPSRSFSIYKERDGKWMYFAHLTYRAKPPPPATPADRAAHITAIDAKGQALPESFLWQDWDTTPHDESKHPLCLIHAHAKCEAKFIDLDGDGAAEILVSAWPQSHEFSIYKERDGRWMYFGVLRYD